MGEAVSREAVNQPVGVAEVVVEARSDDTGRERAADVADVLADLVPDVRDVGGFRRAFQIDEDGGEARLGVAAQEIEALRLLQLALDALGHLLQRVVHRRAGPCRLYDHRPEGEGRVLGAAKPEIGQKAPDRRGDHQENDE